MSQITEEQRKIYDSLVAAQGSDKPFVVPTKDKTIVIGDTAKMDSGPKTYEVEFSIPMSQVTTEKGTPTEDGKFMLVKKTYSGVVLTARKARRLRHYVSILVGMITALKADGDIEFRPVEQWFELYGIMDEQVTTAMESLVGIMLDFSESEMNDITDISLVTTVSALIEDNAGFFQ